jgi:hypothetical protein
MNKIIYKTEKEMQKELNKKISEWKQGNSKDGFVLAGEGKFKYKGIAYLIKVVRYYNHTNRFVPMSSRKSDKHVWVESTKETQELAGLVNGMMSYNNFLYHDTLGSYFDKKTIAEQIKAGHKIAKEDIDGILPMIKKKIKELTRIVEIVENAK